MRNSVFVSLAAVILCAVSCAPGIRNGCAGAHEAAVLLSRHDIRPVIRATDSLQTFDMEISFMGKHVNGMLLVKKQAGGAVRVVMNSYFGMSMMDFELSPDTAIVHYLLPAMNKPAVANLFKNDFRLLLGLNIPEKFPAARIVCKHPESLIIFRNAGGKYFYKINNEQSTTVEIKAPGTRIKNKESADEQIIELKRRRIFTPTLIIRKNNYRN